MELKTRLLGLRKKTMGTRMLELLFVFIFALVILFVLLRMMRAPNTERKFRVDNQGEEPWDPDDHNSIDEEDLPRRQTRRPRNR